MSQKSIRDASRRVEESHAQNLRDLQVRNREIRRQRLVEETPRIVVAQWAGLSPAQVKRIEDERPDGETYDDGE